MKTPERKLLRDILIVLAIKFALLYTIWACWISDQHVTVTAQSAADHLLIPAKHP